MAVVVADEGEEDGAAADYLEEDMAVAMGIRMRMGLQWARWLKPQALVWWSSRR